MPCSRILSALPDPVPHIQLDMVHCEGGQNTLNLTLVIKDITCFGTFAYILISLKWPKTNLFVILGTQQGLRVAQAAMTECWQ